MLGISQQLAFANNSGTIDFSVTLTNNGTSTMSNVAYARGLDPDQDVFAGGGYPTTNNIVNGNLVTASAPVSGWTIGIFSDSDIAHLPTVHADWSYQSTSNPYYLLDPKNDGNGDYSINMAWNIGELAAGESANIKFQYRIAESFDDVVVPPTHGVADAGSTVGLLGLGLGALAAFKARKRRA